MSKPVVTPAVSPRGRVLKGDAARKASGAGVLTDTLDSALAAKHVPKTAAQARAAERADALQQGYNDGLAQARAEVEAAMNDANIRVHRALAALCEAVDSFDRRQTIALVDVEDAIAASAIAIASAVLQREITVAANPGAEAIARALKLVPSGGEIVARLNPDDATTLSTDTVSTSTHTVRVIADPSIEVGGCIIDAGTTSVDAQISSALDKVRTALRLTPDLPIEQVEPLRMQTEPAIEMPSVIAGSDTTPSRTTASEAPSA